jgi:hypothetical protein
MSNGSIIDKGSKNARHVLPDRSPDTIPPYPATDNSLRNATWVIVDLLACVLILVLGTVLWNARQKGWNRPDYMDLGNPTLMLQPRIYGKTFIS